VTTYRVGQVLYVVLHKETKIYPLQVVEEVIKKTLEGTATTYMVRGGPNVEQSIPIAEVDGEIFDSAVKLQKVLLERATNGINAVVQNAVTKAHEWYPTGFEESSDDELASIRKPAQPGQMPPVQQPKQGRKKQQQGAPSPEMQALTQELAAETANLEVKLDDGTVAKVKLPPGMAS
jgi:hypothetical protein